MANRPSFQFYPGDWLSNTNLKRCTFEEKGVWIEVICLMNDSDEYGILRWPLVDIAIAIRCDLSVLSALVKKNILKGSDDPSEEVTFSTPISQKNRPPIQVTMIDKQKGPIWYSSRMVRDEYKRKKRADGGYKALEHPNVPKKKKVKDTFSPSFDCSSSPSTSSTSILKDKQSVLSDLPEWLDKEVWDAFVDHRKAMKAPMNDAAKIRAIKKIQKLREDGEDITELLNNSIINGWKGFFPDRNKRPSKFKNTASNHEQKKASATEQTIMRALTHVNNK